MSNTRKIKQRASRETRRTLAEEMRGEHPGVSRRAWRHAIRRAEASVRD